MHKKRQNTVKSRRHFLAEHFWFTNTVYKRTIFVHLLVLEIGAPSDLNVSKYFKLFFEVRLVFK